jgi:hypothetical protein
VKYNPLPKTPTEFEEVPEERTETTCLLRWAHETVIDYDPDCQSACDNKECAMINPSKLCPFNTTYTVQIQQGKKVIKLTPTASKEIRISDIVVGESYTFSVFAQTINGVSEKISIGHKQLWVPSPVKALAEV